MSPDAKLRPDDTWLNDSVFIISPRTCGLFFFFLLKFELFIYIKCLCLGTFYILLSDS